jgi:hypothetical protein
MATFAMCKDTSGHTTFVNVEQVRMLEPMEGHTVVRFDKDHTVSISGPASAITNPSEYAKR